MSEKLYLLADKILNSTFYILFFAVPLVFFPKNYELFEFNKMMLTYALAAVVFACWAIKCVTAGKLIFRRTLLFLPLLLFLLSQILSTIVSIDPHTSLWGYYTRANGGLLSTVTYILLYWAFASNFDIRKTQYAIRYLLSSAAIISLWGILEHFGKSPSCLFLTRSFDTSCWVQDVQTRVFASLGQPNWMAAFLVAVMPLAWALTLADKEEVTTNNFRKLLPNSYYLIVIILFLALLFTKSRSGLLGFAAAFTVFWIGVAWINRKSLDTIIRPLVLLVTCYLLLVTIFGTPWTPRIADVIKPITDNRKLITENRQLTPESGTVLERGGTESGEIRKIVWKGAIDAWRAYPLFGSGVETFAYSYYNFRPIEHNLTSEWNFLYNKAHNEYLNFLATTGVFGLGTYLYFIGAFLVWSFLKIKNKTAKLSSTSYQKSKIKDTDKNHKQSLVALQLKNFDIFNCHFDIYILNFALLAGFASILVTSFFGFSVVPVALLLFLYPAMAQVVTSNTAQATSSARLNIKRLALILVVLPVTCYLLLRLSQFWYADILFAQADKLLKSDEPTAAAEKLEKAIRLNSGEPNYYDKLAAAYSTIAATFAEENNAQKAQEYAELAKQETDKAYAASPRSISLLKSRASTFSRLSSVDPIYLTYSLVTLERAAALAPTDPITNYNLGVTLYRTGETKRAIETLEKLNEMKPDYADSRFALAEIYILENRKEDAKRELEYILKNIDPQSELAKKLLEGLLK